MSLGQAVRSGAELSGAELSGAERSGAERSGGERSGGGRSGGESCGAARSGAESAGVALSGLRVPEELSAREPAEQRGAGRERDSVRLLVSRGAAVSHHAFRALPSLLRAGDLLVVNTSPTLAAALDGRTGGAPVVVHFSTRGDDGRWVVELREPDTHGTTRARPGEPTAVELPGGAALVLEEPLDPAGTRLWWARASVDVAGLLRRYGRPIRYSYTRRDQPLAAYQTVFALPQPGGAGSAEMPSAGRPFTARLVAELVSRGVQFAPVTLHTGVASAEAHEPPYPERFEVPAASARLINAAKAGGGRIIAVGTTGVRAVESAAGRDGIVRPAAGWTGLVVTPERGVRVVDGLLTGLHEPEASHLLMLEAIAGQRALERSYAEAVRGLYLWHEFGDSHLILPEENDDAPNCSGNGW